MDIFQAFVLLNSNGVSFLRALVERSPYDVASHGIALSDARSYTKLADVLFGSTTSPRLQRESVALAEERGLSADHLVMINNHASKLDKRGEAWKLRAELIAFEGSYEEVNKLGGQRVKEILGPKPKQAGVTIGRAIDGMRTMTVTATSAKSPTSKRPSTRLSLQTNPAHKHSWMPSGTTSKAAAGCYAPNTGPSSPLDLMISRRSALDPAMKSSLVSPTAPR